MAEFLSGDSIVEPESKELAQAEDSASDQVLEQAGSKDTKDTENSRSEAIDGQQTEDDEAVLEFYQSGQRIELESGTVYEVEGLLGRGGMGQVYRARHCQTNEVVALKTLNKDLQRDNAASKRFRQEAQTAKSLNHKNLTSVYDFETTTKGDTVIVMEFVEGESLRQKLDESGEMQVDSALDLFIELAEGIGHAHKNGIIHRDIKPSNVILAADEFGTARVLDFGIAKVESISSRETQDLTRTGGVFGSPHYMSPEQCLGFRLDERSDIYSLGCLMYETITGEPPFSGDNPMQLVVSHINENPPCMDRAYRSTSKGSKLENVILRCLAKEQDDRYQNMDEVLQDLMLIKEDKQIPKYDTKKNIKAAYSPTSMAYLLTAVCLVALVFSIFPSDTLPADFWYYLQGGAWTILSVIGSYICLGIFKNKLKALDHGLAKINDWFALLFALFSGLTAFAMIPFMLATYFAHRESVPFVSFITLDHISVVIFWSMACAAVTVLLSILSGIGRFVFRGGKKVSLVKPLSILLVLGAILVSSIPHLAPRALSGLTYRLGWAAIRTAPEAAVAIYNCSFELDPRKGLPSHLISIYDQNNDLKGAIKIATKYMDVYKDSDKSLYNTILLERALLYQRDGQHSNALSDAYYLIGNSPSQRAIAYAIKANVESNSGDYPAALASIEKSIGVDPSYANYAYPVKIGILCKSGQYEEALREINRIEKRGSYRIKWDTAEGIIYDHLGHTARAEAAFDQAYIHYKYLLKTKEDKLHNFREPRRDERLAGAYAAYRIGRKKESMQLLQRGSEFEFPPRKEELVDRLFNYSWDIDVPW